MSLHPAGQDRNAERVCIQRFKLATGRTTRASLAYQTLDPSERGLGKTERFFHSDLTLDGDGHQTTEKVIRDTQKSTSPPPDGGFIRRHDQRAFRADCRFDTLPAIPLVWNEDVRQLVMQSAALPATESTDDEYDGDTHIVKIFPPPAADDDELPITARTKILLLAPYEKLPFRAFQLVHILIK